MSKSPVVVVDSDVIIAQNKPDDSLLKKTSETFEKLANLNAMLIYPSTTIAEATTHIQRALNNSASAYGTAQILTSNAEVAEVNQQTLTTAMKYFSPTATKKNTIFDCIVAAVAEEKQADAIFSFDKFYTKKGFKLASEL